jgi:hypothetical protein
MEGTDKKAALTIVAEKTISTLDSDRFVKT